jgi:RNase adaptor protein for sRNA GlmZ degradation
MPRPISPPELRRELLDRYIARLADFSDVTRESFTRHYYAYVYVRIMQALGAYGFRGFYERKAHFLQSVPYALKNIRWLLRNAELPLALPALMDALESIVDSEKLRHLSFAPPETTQDASSKESVLTVRVFSFSFRRGIPMDEAGHGGGFIFDARCIINPGREEIFKPLTGKDAAVIDYLDRQDGVRAFLTQRFLS